jgi:hypothetical protein
MTFSLLHIRYVLHSSHPLLLIMMKQAVSTSYGELLTTHYSPRTSRHALLATLASLLLP